MPADEFDQTIPGEDTAVRKGQINIQKLQRRDAFPESFHLCIIGTADQRGIQRTDRRAGYPRDPRVPSQFYESPPGSDLIGALAAAAGQHKAERMCLHTVKYLLQVSDFILL